MALDVIALARAKGGAKGSYTSAYDLPADAVAGTTAVVNGELYYFNGTGWSLITDDVTSTISTAQIDALWP